MEIRKAERKQAKLRIGISAPSGAGKTYSALLLARGLATNWAKIIVIDTENGSGELYSHLGDYNVITLEAPFTPERYIEAITAAEKAGFEVIIIDSVSHEWDGKGGLLEANELLGQTKFKGNTWAAWSMTTPRHQKLLQTITQSEAHVITTARSKTDTVQTDGGKVKKVGLKDIQREGFEYELTLSFNLDRDSHCAISSKDRTGLFIDRDPFVITEKTGMELKEWSLSGKVDTNYQKREILAHLKRMKFNSMDKIVIETTIKLNTALDLKEENYAKIILKLAALETLKQSGDDATEPVNDLQTQPGDIPA